MNRLVLLCLILLVNSIAVCNAAELSSKFIKVNGHQLHYYQAGKNGVPLVLLTGFATTSNFWPEDFVDCLAATHVVYLLDYRGINTSESSAQLPISLQSMAQDVNAFVNKLNLKHVSLLGWSMGGGVALEASKTHWYNRLYLLASLVPTEQQLAQPFKTHGKFKSDADVLNYVFTNNLYGYESSQLAVQRKRFIRPELSTLFPSREIIAAQAKAIDRWQHESVNEQYFKTSRVIASFWLPERDNILNYQVAESVAAIYPNKTIIKLSDSGHAVAWQAGEAVCKDILSY